MTFKIIRGEVQIRDGRRNLLKKVYDSQVQEFTEDNEPTQIVTFFEDVINALPNIGVERNDLEALFKYALEEK